MGLFPRKKLDIKNIKYYEQLNTKDCLRTAIACLINKEPSEVPVTKTTFYVSKYNTLESHNSGCPEDDKDLPDFETMLHFLKLNGYKLKSCAADKKIKGYYIALIDCEDWSHAVIAKDDLIIHNPGFQRIEGQPVDEFIVLGKFKIEKRIKYRNALSSL